MARTTRILSAASPCVIALVSVVGAGKATRADASVIYTSHTSSLTTKVCDNGGYGFNCSIQQVEDTSIDSFSQSLGTQGSSGYASQQATLSQGGMSVSIQTSQFAFGETGSSLFSVGFGAYTSFLDATASGPPYMGSEPFAVANAQLSFTPVPLPAGGLLLSSGLSGLALLPFRRRRPL